MIKWKKGDMGYWDTKPEGRCFFTVLSVHKVPIHSIDVKWDKVNFAHNLSVWMLDSWPNLVKVEKRKRLSYKELLNKRSQE